MLCGLGVNEVVRLEKIIGEGGWGGGEVGGGGGGGGAPHVLPGLFVIGSVKVGVSFIIPFIDLHAILTAFS